MTLERAVQFVKGEFSYRAGKELDFRGEVWQGGFSDVLVIGEESSRRHQEYIDLNPVRAGLALSRDDYPYGIHTELHT